MHAWYIGQKYQAHPNKSTTYLKSIIQQAAQAHRCIRKEPQRTGHRAEETKLVKSERWQLPYDDSMCASRECLSVETELIETIATTIKRCLFFHENVKGNIGIE